MKWSILRKLLLLHLLLLLVSLTVTAQGRWSCDRDEPYPECQINNCDPGHIPDGECEFTPPSIDAPGICTGERILGQGDCVQSGSSDQAACQSSGGQWNQEVNSAFPGEGCCTIPSDHGVFTVDGQTAFECRDKSWKQLQREDCHRGTAYRYDLQINSLPHQLCAGEVLRDHRGQTQVEYVATNTDWKQATGSCSIIQIEGHSYLDTNRAPFLPFPVWAECIAVPDTWLNEQFPPAETPFVGGLNYLSPDGVQNSPNKAYYESISQGNSVQCGTTTFRCAVNLATGNGRWIAGSGGNPGGGPDSREDQQSCNAGNNHWTGNFCCGDDNQESYNDPSSSTGACFQDRLQRNNNLLTAAETINAVAIVDGKHVGCALAGDPSSSFNVLENDYLLSINDQPNPPQGTSRGPLLENRQYCDQLSIASTDYYCSFSEQWLPVAGQPRDTLKRVPGNPLLVKNNQAQNTNAAPFVFEQPGLFFTPTPGNEVRSIPLNAPQKSYNKVVVELDVTHADWNPQEGKDIHNVFWLYRDEWRSNTLGYVNLAGPANQRVRMSTNFGYSGPGIPSGGAVQKSAPFTPGETYHFRYVFDAPTKTVSLEITHNGELHTTLSNQAEHTSSSFAPHGDGFIIWFGLNQGTPGPETPTYNWEYANLRVEFFSEGTAPPSETVPAECCGIDQCWNGNSCVTADSPDSTVTLDDGTPYYCVLQDGTAEWSDDLDAANQQACEQNGFAWTGSRCCGDDTNEYYNDPAGDAACWNATAVQNDNVVLSNEQIIYDEVRVDEGVFMGCAIDSNNFDDPTQNQHKPFRPNNDELLLLDDCPNSDTNDCGNLVHDSDYCTLTSQHFCSYTETWLPTENRNRSELKYIGWSDAVDWDSTDILEAQCCEPNRCWNGSRCLEPQTLTPRDPPHPGTNLRCVDGEWTHGEQKRTWDGSEWGYCPEQHQCLVNPFSLNTNPELNTLTSINVHNPFDNDIQCINTGQFIGDHYCEQGNWTTRTKLVALQLLDVAETNSPDNYVLYCDEFSDVVNYAEYGIPTLSGFTLAKDFLQDNCNYETEQLTTTDTVPCANNLCVLRYQRDADQEEEVIIGTALNQLPTTTPYSVLTLLDVSANHCNNIINGDGNFTRCKNPDTWYNTRLQSIIYAKEGVNLNRIPFFERFTTFIQNPFQSIFTTIIDVIQPGFPGGEKFDFDFIKQTTDFSRLYVGNHNNKAIHGVMEQIDINEFFSVAYYGFSADICQSVDRYVQATNPLDVISCDLNDGTYFVETLSPTRFETWKDFTAKVRVS